MTYKRPGLMVAGILLAAVVALVNGWGTILVLMVLVMVLVPPQYDPAIQLKEKLLRKAKERGTKL